MLVWCCRKMCRALWTMWSLGPLSACLHTHCGSCWGVGASSHSEYPSAAVGNMSVAFVAAAEVSALGFGIDIVSVVVLGVHVAVDAVAVGCLLFASVALLL